MKTNSKKIVVSTLALAMGAALAGSISGSVAWYQYSTRTTASLSGTSAGTSRNLQISTVAAAAADKDNLNWKWDVNIPNQNLQPVAPVMATANSFPTEFKAHAVRQYATLNAADGDEFFAFDLYFQSLKEGGIREAVDVYLETFEVNFGVDVALEGALRVAITDGTTTWLTSKTAGNTDTESQLDLNGDGVNDRWIFQADDNTGLADDGGTLKKVVKEHLDAGVSISAGTYYTTYADGALSGPVDAGTVPEGNGVDYYKFGDEPGASKTNVEGDYIIYNSGSTVEEYTTIAWDDLESEFTDAYHVTEGDGHFKFSTLTAEDSAAHLQVKIWLDGFAKIGTTPSNIWDDALIGEEFSINMRFQTIAEQ